MASAQEFPVGVVLTIIVVIFVLRLVRSARLNSASSVEGSPTPTRTDCFWGPTRKIEKLARVTALTRAEADLSLSKIEQLRAGHDLAHLVAELNPPPVQTARGADKRPSITLHELQGLLDLVNLDDRTRAELLRLAAALVAEKRS